MLSLYYGNWDLWTLYHKCIFDGINKLIIVSDGVTSLDIQEDVYSAWKEWSNLSSDNAKWPPAIRTIGGDPTIQGEFAGDIYFLINGWKLQYDPRFVAVTGVLFSDDFSTAYYSYEGAELFPAQVTSIVSGSAQIANSDQITQSLGTLQSDIGNLSTANSEILSKVLEVWQLMGLDVTNPKTITDTSITVNGITLTIGQPDSNTTTVTRN